MSSDLAARCVGLVKRYPPERRLGRRVKAEEVVAVDGLDLEVRVGECFGLLGPNGAGKTTTVEILEGLLEPTAGAVEVLGLRWTTHERELRERLGVSLQLTHLPDRLTVLEILTLFRSFFARGQDPAVLMGLVSLDEKRHAMFDKLSGGQKQRLAVACALAGDPDLLFLDEPTTGLDPQSRLQLWDVVRRFREQGDRTVVLTTHYMEEAERLCDRVAIVDHGKVITLGTPRELIASLGGQEVVEFASSPEVTEAPLRALPGVRGVRPVTDGYALHVDAVHLALPALLEHVRRAGASLERLSTRHATLEDVFVALTGRHLRD